MLRTVFVIVVIIIVFNNRFLALFFGVGRRRCRAAGRPAVAADLRRNLSSLLFLQLFLLVLNNFQLISLQRGKKKHFDLSRQM